MVLHLVVVCFLLMTASPSGASAPLDDALERFWQARTLRQARKAAAEILSSGADFASIYRHLEQGPAYSGNVKRERIERVRTNRDGTEHPFFALIPASYDPGRRYPVRFYLHGGVGRPAWDRGGDWWRRHDPLARDDSIAVFPASWRQSPWWSPGQIENLTGILAWLKRSYNVDENRVFLFGVSDGGSGAFYIAGRAPGPWAAFLSLIGHPTVGVRKRAYISNIPNRPFFAANGEVDRLYPAAQVLPWIEVLRGLGSDIEFRPQKGMGHELSWWPDEASNIETFIRQHPRHLESLRLSWQTEDLRRFSRLDWVEIVELGSVAGDSSFAETPAALQLRPIGAPPGRIDLARVGNRVEARTRGIRRFTLLISPRDFDLELPIDVFVNGQKAFAGHVSADAATMLKWAALDRDRTRLFVAEINIRVEESRRAR